jgi:glycerophosphoryl diester phosphodiesterase
MRWLERLWLALENLFPPHCPDADSLMDGGPFLVTGHRGSPAREPENTLASVERAVTVEGANAVEIDLSMTVDGEVVLWHDWDPESFVARVRQRGWEPSVRYRPVVPPPGNPNRRRVSELTLESLRTSHGYARGLGIFRARRRIHIPTFREFVAWAAGTPALEYVFLDIKLPVNERDLAPRMLEGIVKAIEEHRPPFRAVLLTPEKEVFLALRAAGSGLEAALDMEVTGRAILYPEQYRSVPWALEYGSSVAMIGRPTLYTLVPWKTYAEIVRSDSEARARYNADSGAKPLEHLIGWTVNDPRKMKCLIRLGMTGILTDRPKRLRKILERMRRRMEPEARRRSR